MAEEDKKHFEKSPLESKKFLAYLISQVCWVAIIAGELLHFGDDPTLLEWSIEFTSVVTLGFMQVGYILGQAYIDKFVRVVTLTANAATGSIGKSSSKSEVSEETRKNAPTPEAYPDDDSPEELNSDLDAPPEFDDAPPAP